MADGALKIAGKGARRTENKLDRLERARDMPQSAAGRTDMFGWWRRHKEMKARVDADARAMIAKHGDSAYWVVRDLAIGPRLNKVANDEEMSAHWDRVRFEIRKRTGGRRADTATRLLEDGK